MVERPRPVTPTTILADRLASISDRADVASHPELAAELADVTRLAAGLDPYLQEATSPESPELTEVARRTAMRDWERPGNSEAVASLEQEMLSGHVEGKFLAFLVRLMRAKRVLEIGMFTGYSALAMAEALPRDGTLVACEVDPDVAHFAEEGFKRSPIGGRIEVRLGRAEETLNELEGEGRSFDFVFVDADKGGYEGYLSRLLEGGLLSDGAVVCVDNTLLQGEPWLGGERSPNGEAIAAFNRAVADDPRVEQVLIPLRDGLTLIRRV